MVGLVLTFVAFLAGPGGWYLFVGFGYIVYVVIVFVIEMFIEGVYVHRLIVSELHVPYNLLDIFTMRKFSSPVFIDKIIP